MKQEIIKLNLKLNTLSIFRSLLNKNTITSLQALLKSIEFEDSSSQLNNYGEFVSTIYNAGGNLTENIIDMVTTDDNFYIKIKANKNKVNNDIEKCLLNELSILQEICDLSSLDVKELINYYGYLPNWENSSLDIKSIYNEIINNAPYKGYGYFVKHKAFTIVNGQLSPLENVDAQGIGDLYGYQRERNQVLENTKALVQGKAANNVLLYGDAGTGKSSTIKAVANEFYDQGLRLIEFDKNQLTCMPQIMEELSSNPLKFIFYIDDLSFAENNDHFCALKGILEGHISSNNKNIVIYATSNRRHFIKESMDERMGNELHLNDTLQETMSLAARFGLTITFQKPEKELYLEIVKSLADENKIKIPEDELYKKAEAFAIRNNGRSPRTAKQFVQLLSIGL